MNPYGVATFTPNLKALARYTSGVKRSRAAYDEAMAELEPVTPCRDCGRPATWRRRCDLHARAYRAECSKRARDKKKETDR